jgi:hypothetical protein
MIFKNRAETPLSFSLGGKKYDVAIGGECDIPDHLAYAVTHMGLPLDGPKTEAAAPKAGETSAPKMRAGTHTKEPDVLDAHAPAPLPDAPQPKRANVPKEPDVLDAHAPPPLPNDPPPKVRAHPAAHPEVQPAANAVADTRPAPSPSHEAAPATPHDKPHERDWRDDDRKAAAHDAPTEEGEGRRKTTKR